jgi:hypothetical protein
MKAVREPPSANNIHAILPINCNYLEPYMSDHINGAQKSEDQNNRNYKVETQKSDSNVYEIVQSFCSNNI